MRNDLNFSDGTVAAAAIAASPSYRQLRLERSRLARRLSIFVLVVYYMFVMVVAFKPTWLAQRINGTTLTVGFPIAAGMFVVFWLLTGLYSRRANGRFDDLARKAIEEMTR
jgi:uncharacterized membrane protein (DUF485 family)